MKKNIVRQGGHIGASCNDAKPLYPAFTRLPKPPAKCPVSGLCRSTLVQLTGGQNPPVRSKILKQPGSSRGIRIIEVASLISYLEALPDASANFNLEGDHYEG